MEFAVVGRIIGFDVEMGLLKIQPYAPRSVFEGLSMVFLKKRGGEYVVVSVRELTFRGDMIFLSLEGFDSAEELTHLKGAHLYLPAEELPERGEDEFYIFELVGMRVISDSGRELGMVRKVMPMGEYELLLTDRDIYIPFVSAVVLEVDRRGKRITVRDSMIP